MEESPAFIGKGWQFPPRFGKAGQVVYTVTGVEEVNQGIEILLRTQLGERLLDQNFGCNLESYAFADLNATLLSEIRGNIEMAMVNYERRIDVLNVEVSADDLKPGLIYIEVDYLIPETNSRYNKVFPYYLEEAAESV